MKAGDEFSPLCCKIKIPLLLFLCGVSMKKHLLLFLLLMFSGFRVEAAKLLCYTEGSNNPIQRGQIDLYVNVREQFSEGPDFLLYNNGDIYCQNSFDKGSHYMIATQGSNMSDSLGFLTSSDAKTSVVLGGDWHNSGPKYFTLPLSSDTYIQRFGAGDAPKTLPILFVLSPANNASRVLVEAGQKVATLYLRSQLEAGGPPSDIETWVINVFAKNKVFLNTGGCDVSSRSILVDMGDYSIDAKEKDLGLSIRCRRSFNNLTMGLSGQTEPGTDIFSNVATWSPSSGVGIEILKDGQRYFLNQNVVIAKNSQIGADWKSLNMKVKYALNGQPLRPGNFYSNIKVSFTYN
jgi:type 1 fimbria pilin